jgi:hypothetical protein
MRFNGNRLRNYIDKNKRNTGINQRKLAEMVGMDRTNLNNAMRRNQMNDLFLEKIMEILHLDVGWITDMSDAEDSPASGPRAEVLKRDRELRIQADIIKAKEREIELLRETLAGRDRLIDLLEKNNKLLEERFENLKDNGKK